MGTIRITIETDNAAFEDGSGWEVARIVREYAERIQHGRPVSCRLRDSNGNTVGKVEVD